MKHQTILRIAKRKTKGTSFMAPGNADSAKQSEAAPLCLVAERMVFVAATEPVAELASSWNLPIISWSSSDSEFADKSYYTTLIRTFGSMAKTGD